MMYAQFKPAYQVRQVDVLAAVYEGLPIRLGRLKSCKQCNAISSKQCNAISSKQDDKEGRSFSFKRKGKEGDLRIERRKREKSTLSSLPRLPLHVAVVYCTDLFPSIYQYVCIAWLRWLGCSCYTCAWCIWDDRSAD